MVVGGSTPLRVAGSTDGLGCLIPGDAPQEEWQVLFVDEGWRSSGLPGILRSLSCRHRILLTDAPLQVRRPRAIGRAPAAPL